MRSKVIRNKRVEEKKKEPGTPEDKVFTQLTRLLGKHSFSQQHVMSVYAENGSDLEKTFSLLQG